MSAASLTRLARSAPTDPGVRLATCRRSTLLPSRTLRTCTLRIASRPTMSGRSTTTVRSKRPGRSRAASSVSGRVVAAGNVAGTGLSQSVQLVDEYDARRAVLGLGKQVANACGAHADEHLDK